MPTANKNDVPAGIPNLWPVDQIRVDVLTPLAILRVQAVNLNQISRGVLTAEVATTTTDKQVAHSLDVIAPLINYRQRLLTITYDKEFVYPATIATPRFKRDTGIIRRDQKMTSVEALAKARDKDFDEASMFAADSQETLIQALGEFLKSGYVISVLQSLLAQSNEANREEFASEAA